MHVGRNCVCQWPPLPGKETLIGRLGQKAKASGVPHARDSSNAKRKGYINYPRKDTYIPCTRTPKATKRSRFTLRQKKLQDLAKRKSPRRSLPVLLRQTIQRQEIRIESTHVW